MSRLANTIPFKTYLKYCLTLILLVCSYITQAQDLNPNGNKFILGEITVKGNTSFSEQTIIAYSGLRKGEEITIPGEQISDAIKKLWKSKLFNDIDQNCC